MTRRRTNPPPAYDATAWDVISILCAALVLAMVVW